MPISGVLSSVLALISQNRAARVVALAGIAALLVLAPLLYALAVARHRESFSAFLPAAMFVGLAVALLRERATEEVERREPGASPALGD